jgi:hypothetical protein
MPDARTRLRTRLRACTQHTARPVAAAQHLRAGMRLYCSRQVRALPCGYAPCYPQKSTGLAPRGACATGALRRLSPLLTAHAARALAVPLLRACVRACAVQCSAVQCMRSGQCACVCACAGACAGAFVWPQRIVRPAAARICCRGAQAAGSHATDNRQQTTETMRPGSIVVAVHTRDGCARDGCATDAWSCGTPGLRTNARWQCGWQQERCAHRQVATQYNTLQHSTLCCNKVHYVPTQAELAHRQVARIRSIPANFLFMGTFFAKAKQAREAKRTKALGGFP